jgi:hypothetical protein
MCLFATSNLRKKERLVALGSRKGKKELIFHKISSKKIFFQNACGIL